MIFNNADAQVERLCQFSVFIRPVAVELLRSRAILAIVIHSHTIQLLLVADASGLDSLACCRKARCSTIAPCNRNSTRTAISETASSKEDDGSKKAAESHVDCGTRK